MSENGTTRDERAQMTGDTVFDARLHRLEELLAYQERMSHELSDLMARHAAEIDRLTRQIAALMAREQSRESEREGGVFLGVEKPPHW